jgi:hypothetical protein
MRAVKTERDISREMTAEKLDELLDLQRTPDAWSID